MRYEIRPLGPWIDPPDATDAYEQQLWTGTTLGRRGSRPSPGAASMPSRRISPSRTSSHAVPVDRAERLQREPAEMTVGQAAEFLAHWAGDDHTAAAILADGVAMVRAYRAAAKRTHPDVTGDEDTFKRINVARDVLLSQGGRS